MGVLEQTYNTAMEKPLRVLEIFNEFFGESRVDMQGFPTFAEIESRLPQNASVTRVKEFINYYSSVNDKFILVHFPHVRVTNEYGKFTDINHLYAKVIIDIYGKIMGRFLLNRSEYSVLHFTNDYMHSHISNIPIYDLTQFQMPCTGSGPINSTICSLSRDFDADLWRLFCLELDRFTQVESIAGTPYHRLEGLVAGGRRYSLPIDDFIKITSNFYPRSYGGGNTINFAQIADFTKYVIDSNILKFSYQRRQYVLAMRPTQFFLAMSDLFIKWYNKNYALGKVTKSLNDLLASNLIFRARLSNGKIVKPSNNRINYLSYIGRKVCTFKGRDITLTIPDITTEGDDDNDIMVLAPELSEYILTKIYNVINFRYGNDRQNEGDRPHKEVIFI